MDQLELELSNLNNRQITECKDIKKYGVELIVKYSSKVNWGQTSFHAEPNLFSTGELKILGNLIGKDQWRAIFMYRDSSYEELEELKDIIDWSEQWFLEYAKFYEFFEKFIDKYALKYKFRWEEISKKDLSESFILKHSDKISWPFVLGSKNISEEFLIEHVEKGKDDQKGGYVWAAGANRKKYSEETIDKLINKINWDHSSIDVKNVSETLAEKIIRRTNNFYYQMPKFKNRKEKFSKDFIKRNKNYINFENAEIYKHMDLELIQELKDHVNWAYISRYMEFSKEFFIQNIEKLDLSTVFKNKKLKFLETDVKFVEKDIELLLKLNGYVLVPTIKKQ